MPRGGVWCGAGADPVLVLVNTMPRTGACRAVLPQPRMAHEMGWWWR